MKYLIYLGLFLYGFLYHISSSEFWPITISKTWFTPEHFEYSMLQKPLLSIFLSLFHLLALTDIQHILLVKFVFTLIGIFSLYSFAQLIHSLTKTKLNFHWLILIFVAISPVTLNNFFNIRSDQLAFLFFTLMLLKLQKDQFYQAAFFLALIPLAGIKEIIFALPAGLLFYQQAKHRLNFKLKLYLFTSIFAVFLWALALNLSSFVYLINTFDQFSLQNAQIKSYLYSESPLLILSLLCCIYNLYRKSFIHFNLVSIYFVVLLFLIPQSYSFLIASFSLYIYLPLFIYIQNHFNVQKIKILATGSVYIIYLVTCLTQNIIPLYLSNKFQLIFIREASGILQSNSLNYLDGAGILPRQKFIPCFISPDDDEPNNNCKNNLIQALPDSIIITTRLSSLGSIVYDSAQAQYTQVRPNLWIRNDKINKSINIDLDNSPIPVFLFY